MNIICTTVYGFNQEHTDWNKLLKKYVSGDQGISTVKYLSWKKDPESHKLFERYISELSEVKESEFSQYNQNDRLAFLINAYNAFTIKLIMDHYPVKSIKDLGSLFSTPWKKKFFQLFKKNINLDEIEHEFIRKKFNEPRIHFAIVCASKSCPPLRPEAYVGIILEQQLQDQTLKFLKDTRRNKFDLNSKTLTLSKILEWYGDDFVKKYGSVKSFVSINIASNNQEKSLINSESVKVKYFDYDWSLNE